VPNLPPEVLIIQYTFHSKDDRCIIKQQLFPTTSRLALALFMPGIFFADNSYNAFPANNLAAIATFFY
jgi:hypothetical protein